MGLSVDTVVITRMTTSGCVRATVLDAFPYKLDVVVPAECVADCSQISHRVSLFDMHMKQADVARTDRVVGALATSLARDRLGV